MRDAECVPEYDICVFDTGVTVRDPLGNSSRWLAGRLGNVAAGGKNLLVVI
jgi:hypothetical protein